MITNASDQGVPQRLILSATALTNLVMFAALVLGALVRVPWSRALGIATLACAAFDTSWLFLLDGNRCYEAGYWVWLASFALVGLGLVVSRPQG